MLHDNLQARADREPQQWDEGIPVPNAVHIVIAGSPDQLSDSLVTATQSFQNHGIYLLGGFYLLRRPSTSSTRVRGNVCANEPTAEPAKADLVYCSVLAAIQGNRNRWHKDLICDPEVLHALSDAPGAQPGLPVELDSAECFSNRLGAPISSIQLGNKTQRPSR